MAGEDFYVQFGSNLREGKGGGFLAQMRTDVGLVKGLIDDLKRSVKEGETAAAQGLRLGLLGPGGGAGGGAAGGSTPAGLDKKTLRNVNAGLEQMVGHIDDVLGRVTQELAGAAKGTAQVTTQMLAAARLMKKGAEARNRSEARILAILEGGGKEGKRNDQGRFAKKDDPNATPVTTDKKVRSKKDRPAQSIFDDAPTSIANVPAAMIDEAQINRLVDVSKTISKNTQGTNTRLDRLIAVVNEKGIKVQREGGAGGGTTTRDPKEPRRPRGSGPAEAKAAKEPITDDSFARVSQLRGQIQKQERLAELLKAQERLKKGVRADNNDPNIAKALDLRQFGRDNNFQGPKVEKRITNAITSLQAELAQVPKLTALKKQLDQAIAATGTADGRRPRDENGRLIGQVPERKVRKRAERQAQAAGAAEPVTATPSPEDAQANLKQRVKDLKERRNALRSSVGQAGMAEGMLAAILEERKADEAAGKKRKKGQSTAAQLEKDLAAATKEREDAERELAKTERSLAKAQLAKAGVTREMEREVNQRVAKAKGRTGPSGIQARNTLAQMDIAGDKSALATLSREQLFGLVETYRGQGLEVQGVGKRSASGALPRDKKEAMIEGLSAANARWDAGEIGTVTGIEKFRRGKSEKISGAARKAAERLMKLMADTIDEAANTVISQDYAAGGTGRGKGKRGKTDNAYGNNIRESGAPRAAGPTKDDVDYAFGYAGQGGMRDRELERAGRREAARAIKKDPNFNPFGSDFDVSGNSDAATATRQAIAKIRKGSEAFDALGRSIMKYHQRIQEIDARTARLSQIQDRLAALAQKETLTPKQTREYTGLLADEKRLKRGAADDAAERKAVEKNLRAGYREGKKTFGEEFTYGTFAPENFQAGYDQRRGARKLLEQQREEARLKRADPSLLTFDDQKAGRDQRYGLRDSIGVGSGVIKGAGGKSGTVKRTNFDSLLPPIMELAKIAEMYPNFNKKALAAAQKAERRLQRAEAELLQMNQENRLAEKAGEKKPYNQNAIESRKSEIAARYSELLTAVEKVSPAIKIPTAISAEESARTGQNRTYTSLDALKALRESDKKAAEQRKINNEQLKKDAAEGRNLVDPASLLAKNKKGRTELERQAVRAQDGGMESALLKSQQTLAQFDRAITKARRGAEKVGKTFDDQKFAEAYVRNGLIKGGDAGGLAGLAAAAGNSKASSAFSRAAELQKRAGLIGEMDKSALKESRVAELAAEQANLMRQARVQGATGLAAMGKGDLAKGRDLIGQEQIERAREVLARSGVRFSDTINTSLAKAKNLPQLLKALEDAIRKGTLQISQYLGPDQVARDARGGNNYRVGATSGSAISPDSRDAYTRDGQPVVLGPDARRSAEAFAEQARRTMLAGTQQILPGDVGSAARKASPEPSVLGAYTEVFGPKGAAARQQAKAAAITTSAALDKALDRAQKVVGQGAEAKPFSVNGARGQLAKAAGVDQADFREGGVAGLQRLIDVARGQGASGRAAESANTDKTVAKAAREAKAGGFSDDCCTRLLEALNRIDKRLMGTLKVAGTVKATAADGTTPKPRAPRAASKADEDAATDQANAVERQKKRKVQFSPDALAAYEASIVPVMSQVAGGRVPGVFGRDKVGDQELANAKSVELGTALVRQGYGDRAKVVDFLRQKLKLTAEAAADLDRRLASAVKSEELAASGQRGSKKSGRRSVMQEEEKRRDERRTSTKTEKEAAEARLQADQVSRIAAAYALLNDRAKLYLQQLKDMQKAGASAADIVAKQKQFYEAAALSMAQQRPTETATTRKQAIGTLMGSEQYGMGMKINQQELARVGRDAEQTVRRSMLNAAQGNSEQASPLIEALFGGRGFMSRVVGSLGTFMVRNFSAGLVFGITNALQDMIAQALETEATFIRVSSALEATGRASGGLRTDLQSISTDYGVALKDVYTTAAGLTGVFQSNEELAGGTRIAAQLESISRGALNSTEAMKALASVTTAFGDDLSGAEGFTTGLDGLIHVADVLTVIQDNLGVNIEDTVEGVGRLAGQAKQLGLSFEETAVYVAAISKLTNQSGQASGEQFSRILSQVQTGRGQAALIKNLGPESGIGEALATRDYSASLEILMENYDGLNKAQKDNIAVTLGGARQAAAINALLEQGAKVRDTVRRAEDANGDAAERAAKIAETLNNRIKILQQNFVNLTAALVRSGILNFLGAMLMALNAVLGMTNTFLSVANDLADSNPITRFARDAAGSILGLLIAIKLLQAGLRALRGVLVGAGIMGRPGQPAVPGLPGQPGTPAQPAQKGVLRRTFSMVNPLANFGADPSITEAVRRRTLLEAATSRTASGTGRLGAALQASGQAFAARATTVGPVPAFGTRGAGAAPAIRAGIGSSLAGVGSGLNRLSSGLTTLSSKLAASAVGATAASAAMSALGIALTFVIMEAFRSQQFSDDLKAAVKADQSKDTAAEEDEIKRYGGRYQELVEENEKSLGGVRGYFRALGQTYNPMNWGKSADEMGSEAAGDLTDEKLKDGRNVDQAIFKQMQGSYQRISAANASKNIEALNEANKISAEELNKLKDDINASDMSDPQKAQALAEVSAIEESVQAAAAKAQLKIKGLNNLNVLTTAQLDQLSALTQTMASAGTSSYDFSSLVGILSNDLGAQEGSDYERLLNEMNDPGARLSGVERNQKLLEIERLNLQMLEAKLADADNLDPNLVDELSQKAQQALGRYEQLRASILEATVNGAIAMSTELRASGDTDQALSALEPALAALAAEAERYRDDPEKLAEIAARRRQIEFQATETKVEPKQLEEQEARSRGRNRAALASSEVREARALLDAYEEEGSGASVQQISQARQRYNQALHAEADALQGAKTSSLQLAIAQTLNALAKSQLEEAAALNAVNYARQQFGEGSSELLDAQARYVQAQENRYQAGEAERVAARETSIAQIAPGDAVAVARARRDAAQAAQDQARRYGTTSTQYQQATQALIAAQREVNNAVRNVAAADADLQIAIAEAAGDRVAVARAQQREAERLYAVALKEAGGNTRSESVIRAEAARVRAATNTRDTIFSDQMATIDFQKEIGEISANTAISMLQEMLRQTNLTEEQRRQLRLKIKGLQADIQSSLTGSGFNIPDQIKLPTAYEVRRSLGIDPYVDEGQARLDDLGKMRDRLSTASLAAPVSQQSTLASSTSQVINNTPVTVNNTVSTPAMVEAVARRVVELISTQTSMGARANQTSPALVRY